MIDHINCVRDDNRIENLELMRLGSHASIHANKWRVCSVPNCGRKHEAYGFCNLHYRRALMSGKAFDRPPKRVPKNKGISAQKRQCTADGCNREEYAIGMCSMHYQRTRKSALRLVPQVRR
jgi:hypothetical protein